MGETGTKAYGYVRVSTEEQAQEGLSIEVQTEKIRQYAALRDLDLVEIIVDAGISGSTLDRPGMTRLRELLCEEETGHVITYKFDRLSRKLLNLLQLVDQEIAKNKVKLHSIGEQIDTSTAMGRAQLQIIGVFAELTLGQIGERTKEALALKKAKGERLGTTPFGFRTPGPGEAMVPNDEEIEVAKAILSWYDQTDWTLQKIADTLNEEGFTTKRGGKWYPTSVQRVVKKRDRYESWIDATR